MFFRTIFELLITIVMVIAVRSLLGGVLRGLGGGSRSPGPASQSRPNAETPTPQLHGQLHRDPVCGTFVAESTRFQRQIGAQTVYYCSSQCREKHSFVAQ